MDTSDSSQLSDASGISRIRSSTIRPWDKFDSIFNPSEVRASSSIQEPTINKSVESTVFADSSTNPAKINKAIVDCEEAITNYAKLELIEESLQEAATSESCQTLQTSTAARLKENVEVEDVKKYLQLPKTDKTVVDDLTLLDIKHLPKTQLSHGEKREIRAAVEKKLTEKLTSFITCYEKLGGNVEDAMKKHASLSIPCSTVSQGSDSMRWKDQTDELCGEYYRDLLRCAELVKQWQNLKYNDMRELDLKKAECLLLQAQVAELQAKILPRVCELKMFQETPRTAEAFKILSEKLDAKILETREQINKKKALKIAYEDVSTPEYDQVLNKCKEVNEVIKKKERLMEML